jgi:probable HAF family extracellular repeat protein
MSLQTPTVIRTFQRKLYRGFFGFSGNSTLAVPGSNHISAQGINDFGQVVGLYYDRDAAPHGFLYSNGVYTTLNAPDSPIRRRCTPTLFPAILGLHPSRLGCIDGRAFRTVSERDISAADFAKIYSVEHGRNYMQEPTANPEYFRRTDERVPKVKASPVRQCPRNHVVRRYDKAGRDLYSRG